MEKGKLKKRRIKLLGIFICLALVSCASIVDHKYFDKTLGLNIDIEKKIFDSSDAINPQGEGFSIESYRFKLEEGKNLFQDKSSYPRSFEVRKNWKISQWKNGPLDNNDIQGLLFKYQIEDSGMTAQLQMIKEALKSSDNYFSYYYKDYDGEIYAVDICIVDIKKNIIYLCEVIT